MRRLMFDSESDGFVNFATKVHCIGAIDVDTEERLDWKPEQIDDALAALDTADTIIGHNIQRHDLPLLEKLKGFKLRNGVLVRDTMILARLIVPNVKDTDGALVRAGKMPPGKKYQGKHTIAAWGYRLGNPKGDYAEVKRAEAMAKGFADEEAILRYIWGEWNEEMHEYMLQDVETNYELWKYLKPDDYSLAAVELEHRIARVCDAMEQAGVPFDRTKAAALHSELVSKKAVIEKRLKEQFGFWYAPTSPTPSRATFTPKKDNKALGYTAGAPLTKIKRVDFNPGSRAHISKVLLDRGWKPTKFTDGGEPKYDEEVIEGIVAQFPEMDGIGEYLMIEKRLSQLVEGDQAWLKVVRDDDGRIHGVINPMGTTTSRAAHMFPNMGQVVSVKKPYGKECRGLFYAPKGWKLVGADQEGLELRCLAHYLYPLDGGAYSKVVCHGDPHWMHAQAMGLIGNIERDKHNLMHTVMRDDGSKKFIYAYIYGCWDDKAGQIIHNALMSARRQCGAEGEALYQSWFKTMPDANKLRRVGKKVRDGFAERITGYKQLQSKIGDMVERFGWLYGLDDRKVPMRSEHSALNFLIQSAGAIICKRWVVDAFEELSAKYKHGWDGDFVFGLWVHDEIQVFCRDGLEEEIGEVLVRCAKAAGEPYGFRVPLDSKAQVGRDWSETH